MFTDFLEKFSTLNGSAAIFLICVYGMEYVGRSARMWSKASAASFFLFPFIARQISLRASCAESPRWDVADMM